MKGDQLVEGRYGTQNWSTVR